MTFIDAGALVAFFDVGDPFFEAATHGFRRLQDADEATFTTPLCIAEALSVLGGNVGHREAAAIARDIFDWQMDIVRPTLVLERRAVALMETYADRGVGYVDCVSFVVMDARACRTAFTFDAEHFVKVRKLTPWVPIPRGKKRRG